ncbi:hypothetical protein BCR33DRAFT_501524 [Rhizoclosmatium globosum]|uniref:GATA-type domain-containing protein n=1 Tax=Rhizoclosmatium globosum TaxID=329046 RepID=A0A1Y2CVI6_9FUNG|nr:hypothetical protein BCR33DRAFT_501524 [Rhizoclosmatium globosum]|eukprot:ORY51033.1 hypothetical protein BCR33DRAFT_501524 [Rhizoclosmatium globosum]
MDPFLASPFFQWQGNVVQAQGPDGDSSPQQLNTQAPQQNHPMHISLNHPLNGLALLTASPSMNAVTSMSQVQFWNPPGVDPVPQAFGDNSTQPVHPAQIPQFPNNYFEMRQPMSSEQQELLSSASNISESPERTPPTPTHPTHPPSNRQRRRRRHNLVPLTQEDLSKMDTAARKRAIKAERKRMRERNRDLVCNECGSTSTPLWRRSAIDPDSMLCNACGLHEKNHLKAQASDKKTLPLKVKESSPLVSPSKGDPNAMYPTSSPFTLLPLSQQVEHHSSNPTSFTDGQQQLIQQGERKYDQMYEPGPRNNSNSSSNEVGLLHPGLLYPTDLPFNPLQMPQQMSQQQMSQQMPSNKTNNQPAVFVDRTTTINAATSINGSTTATVSTGGPMRKRLYL